MWPAPGRPSSTPAWIVTPAAARASRSAPVPSGWSRRGDPGEVAGGAGAEEPSAVDDDDVVAGALQLAQEVRGDEDGDAEVGPDAADQSEHLVAADGVEAVRRLVEEDQLRVVDQGLGELHPLLHARRVAAHGAVALLVQADVAQGVGGPLTGGGRGQPGHPRHVDDELGRRDVRREAVVLRHVSDALTDLGAGGPDVEAQDLGVALRGGGEAEQNLDHGGLAGSVGTHKSGHTGPDVQGEPVKRGHPGEPLAEAFGRDHSHASTVVARATAVVSPTARSLSDQRSTSQ